MKMKTACSWLFIGGYADVVGLLKDRGADPNIADHLSNTPLTVAHAYGNSDMIDILTDAREKRKKRPKLKWSEWGYLLLGRISAFKQLFC